MNTFYTLLIILHATFGGLSLLSGTVALSTLKGGFWHKRSGKYFYYTMMLCVGSGFMAALIPGHENPFLLSVAIFSYYFVFTGVRALRLKRISIELKLDLWVARIMILVGIVMIILNPLVNGKVNIITTVFGAVLLLFSIQDLRLFKRPERFKKQWLRQHISRMTGGFIAAVTAFIVVNQFLPPLVSWLGPGVLGSFFITYWIRKVSLKDKKTESVNLD